MKFIPHPRLGTDNPPTQLEILVHACAQIKAEYKTEGDYFELLSEWISEDREQVCNRCGSPGVHRKRGARKGKCRKCKADVSFTANTFFDGIKRPDVWATIILLTQEGIVFAGNQIHELLKIRNSSIANICKRVDFVLGVDIKKSGRALSLKSENFKAIYRKRSTKTPANEHPVSEQEAAEKEFATDESVELDTAKNRQEPEVLTDVEISASLEGNQKIVFDVLSEQPIHFEAICELSGLGAGAVGSELIMLELEGLIKSAPGDMYSLADKIKKAGAIQPNQSNSKSKPRLDYMGEIKVEDASMDALIFDFLDGAEASHSVDGEAGDFADSIAKKIARFMFFVKEIYRGISRKYLQLYLARYWCLIDRVTWSTESSSLLKACGSFRAISQAELRAYVSQLSVDAIF